MRSTTPRTILFFMLNEEDWRKESVFSWAYTKNVPGIHSHDTSYSGLPGKFSLAPSHLMYETWMAIKCPQSNYTKTFDSYSSTGAYYVPEYTRKSSLWGYLGIFSPKSKTKSQIRTERCHITNRQEKYLQELHGLQNRGLTKVCFFNVNGHQQPHEFSSLALQ